MSELDTLFDRARAARDNAYAPYSRFPVGAAIRSESGSIFTGCNVENAAYPNGICAESGAIAMMVVAGERRINEIAIIGSDDRSVAPCGACRQRLLEFGAPSTIVYLADEAGAPKAQLLSRLLPNAFGPSDLAKARRLTKGKQS